MISFAELDNQRLAINLSVHGKQVMLAGVARHENDGDLGSLLRIPIQDQPGNLEIILRENEWDGTITRLHQADCAYLIQLSANCASLN